MRVMVAKLIGRRATIGAKVRSGRFSLDQTGQTLVDLVVALALLSMAVASAGAVATISANTNSEAGRRTQATALATRELEALRALRDTAERNGSTWDGVPIFSTSVPNGGHYTSAGSCRSFVMRRTGTVWDSVAAGAAKQFTSADDGGNAAFGTSYAGFSRLTTICPSDDFQQADWASANPSAPLVPANGATVGPSHVYTVSEVVSWREGNGPVRTVKMNTILTDWLQ